MKKLLLFTALLIGLISCTEEESSITLPVTGYNWTNSMINGNPGFSDPMWIEPYDTLVDPSQNGVEWVEEYTTNLQDGGYIKSFKYRKIGN